MFLVAYSKSGISVFRYYDNTTVEMVDNVVDLSSERGFSCSRVLVFDDNRILYDFERGRSKAVSGRKDVSFETTLRLATKKDYYLLRRAYDKALANMKCAEFLM